MLSTENKKKPGLKFKLRLALIGLQAMRPGGDSRSFT